jgi:hypothetical protein
LSLDFLRIEESVDLRRINFEYRIVGVKTKISAKEQAIIGVEIVKIV